MGLSGDYICRCRGYCLNSRISIPPFSDLSDLGFRVDCNCLRVLQTQPAVANAHLHDVEVHTPAQVVHHPKGFCGVCVGR